MNQEHTRADESAKADLKNIPENLPEELLPLYDWWRAKGPQSLVTLGAAVLIFGAVWAFRHYRTAKIASANQAFLKAQSLEDLEGVVAQFGSFKAGNAARLRLAKAYFDAGKAQESFDLYELCLEKGAPHGFREIAELGRAHALEALNRLDDALTAYQEFERGRADHFLRPQAVLGIARVLTLQGKKDEARKRLENLKAEKTGDAAWEMAVAQLQGVVDRYEPRAARSLFDAADRAAAQTAPPAFAAPGAVTQPVPAAVSAPQK